MRLNPGSGKDYRNFKSIYAIYVSVYKYKEINLKIQGKQIFFQFTNY